MEKFPVITVCSSMKFKKHFQVAYEMLILNGYIVIPLDVYSDDSTKPSREVLAAKHRQKIDMSDAIFVLNEDGYIGESTKDEIAYAIENGKDVKFLEPLSGHPFIMQMLDEEIFKYLNLRGNI